MSGGNFLRCAWSNQSGRVSTLSCWSLLWRSRSHSSSRTMSSWSVPVSQHKMILCCLCPFPYHNAFVGIWIGYWCPPGQTVDTALPCPPGHFCLQASAAPEPCPPGTYQDREKQADCAVCVAGSDFFFIVYRFFCLALAWKFEM